MKMHIIANSQGEILATAMISKAMFEGDDPPTEVGVIPEPGQLIYEVEAPDNVARMSALELHENYRLEVKIPVTQLMKLTKA